MGNFIFFEGFFYLNLKEKIIMTTLNSVLLIGFAGKDPDVLKTEEFASFIRLKLATHVYFTNKEGQRVALTEWHTVFLNKSLGQTMSTRIKKGMRVFVQGELKSKTWKDQAGHVHHSTAIFAQDCHILVSTEKEMDSPHDSAA